MATIEQRIYSGARAKEILDNEVFQQVFADIEQELFRAWTESPIRDHEGRESLHRHLTMLRRVKSQLETTFQTGKLAQMDNQHKQSMLDKAKAWLTPSDADI